jgi:Tol biopolymer transport system component
MTFLDMQLMRQAGLPVPSPDGRWALYTLSNPDWKEAKRQTDILLVSLAEGVASTRQMTFTKEKNETSPQWLRDGSAFVFLSNRDAPDSASSRNQLYLMRPDGGEARRVTDTKEGVADFALSRDGRWLAYRSGKAGEQQLYRLPIEGIDAATPETLTKQDGGVGAWTWAPDSAAHLLRRPGSRRRTTRRRAARRSSPSNIRNHGHAACQPVGRRPRPARRRPAHRRCLVFGRGLHDLGRWPRGRVPRATRRTATSATSPSRISTPTCTCYDVARAPSSG